jgi:hypothetical protein
MHKYRRVSRLRGRWKVAPYWSYHAQWTILFEFERIVTRIDVYHISNFEDGLETDTFLANITCSIPRTSLRAASDLADRLDVSGGKSCLITVHPEIVVI